MFGFKLVRNSEVKASEKKLSEFEQLEQDKKDLERENENLRQDRSKLKEEVADLGLEKKIADEDIKHMVRMKTESMEIDYQKKELKLEGEKAKEIAKVKDEYQQKVEAQLKAEGTKMEKMYGQILERLPNVNMKISQKD